MLKQVSDCLLAKRGKSKYLDNNTLHSSALPEAGSVSAPWTGAGAGTCPQIPPYLPQIPPYLAQIPPYLPPNSASSSPSKRNREISPLPWSTLDKSLPAPHLRTSPHSANITELPILLEIKSILAWLCCNKSILAWLCCKASRAVGKPKHSWHELSQFH